MRSAIRIDEHTGAINRANGVRAAFRTARANPHHGQQQAARALTRSAAYASLAASTADTAVADACIRIGRKHGAEGLAYLEGAIDA